MVERASPFAVEVAGAAEGVLVEAAPRGSLWQVAAWPETFGAVEAALAEACGCDAPGPGEAAVTSDGRLLIRTEPLKWWILGEDGAACPLQPGPEDGAWLDMSHDQAGVVLMGANAAEICKRMVSLDLRDSAFPHLSFASTHMHHMILKVLRQDQGGTPAYTLMVMRSYADDLRELATHHIDHFG
ncbi:MAG: hypothetical protein AAGH68_04575 [Pseudomonadota bacterium]